MNLVGGRDGLKVGELGGERRGALLGSSSPTWPGWWRGELLDLVLEGGAPLPMFALHRGAGELRRLLICHNRGQTFSCDPQIRDYTGNRDSGGAAVAQVLDLVGRP